MIRTLAGLLLVLGVCAPLRAQAPNPPSRSEEGFTTGEAADVVLAQPGLDQGAAGTGASGVTLSSFPVSLSSVVAAGIAFDSAGNMWLADVGNNRVLRYPASLQDGVTTLANAQAADLVLGQPDFSSTDARTSAAGLRRPGRLAFDANGDLWVADSGNNRIVHFAAPFSNGESADQALGQGDLASGSCAVTQSGLCGPMGLVFDSTGGLWVADTDNNRVIHFPGGGLTTGATADIIVGTTSFTSNSVHRPDGRCSQVENCESPANVLWFPFAVTLAANGDLYVADHESSRIIAFSSPVATGQAASLVLGHGVFSSTSAATDRLSVGYPVDLAFDGEGRMWTADFGNDRVLRYDPPFTNGMPAAIALGQKDFESRAVGTDARTLRGPAAVALDALGDVWVADALNNRVVEYFATAFSTATPATAASLSLHLGRNYDPPGTTFDCQVDTSTTFDSPAVQFQASIPPDADFTFSGLQGGATYFLSCAVSGSGSYRLLGSVPIGTCNGPFEYEFSALTLKDNRSLARAADLEELRDLVDLARADAGLSGYTWGDAPLFTGGTMVRASHVQELRDALTDVYTTCGQSAPAYSDSPLVPGATLIRGQHLRELRDAARLAR